MYINLDLTFGFDFADVHAPILGGVGIGLGCVEVRLARNRWLFGTNNGYSFIRWGIFFPMTMPSRYLI